MRRSERSLHGVRYRLGGVDLLDSCATCNEAKGDLVIDDPCRVLVNGDMEIRADGRNRLPSSSIPR